MKIAVLGTGVVGKCLALAYARKGHEIIVGSRTPEAEKTQALLADMEGLNVRAAMVADAANDGEIAIIALPWGATLEVMGTLSAELNNKIVMDATNPIIWDDGPRMAVADSAGEQIAAILPNSHVVKAFNMIGIQHVLNPEFGEVSADMFICGNDENARNQVANLVAELGFTVQDAGDMRSARHLEPLAMLWIHMAYQRGKGRNIAFKLLEK